MVKLIKRIPCSHIPISNLSGLVLRTQNELLDKPCNSASIVEALPDKHDTYIKNTNLIFSIFYVKR